MKFDHDVLPAKTGEEINLAEVVDALCVANNGFSGALRRDQREQPLPSRDIIIEIVEALRSVLFPAISDSPVSRPAASTFTSARRWTASVRFWKSR